MRCSIRKAWLLSVLFASAIALLAQANSPFIGKMGT
jgi:hypothetical protein